jgi:hypothetical protein
MPVVEKDGIAHRFHHRDGPFHPCLFAIQENPVLLPLSYKSWQIYHILLNLAVGEK